MSRRAGPTARAISTVTIVLRGSSNAGDCRSGTCRRPGATARPPRSRVDHRRLRPVRATIRAPCRRPSRSELGGRRSRARGVAWTGLRRAPDRTPRGASPRTPPAPIEARNAKNSLPSGGPHLQIAIRPSARSHARGLDQRHLGVQCVLKRVERRHHVERGVGPGQVLHQPEPEVGAGHALERARHGVRLDVDAVHHGATGSRESAERPVSASEIEERCPVADSRGVGDHLPRRGHYACAAVSSMLASGRCTSTVPKPAICVSSSGVGLP